MAVLSICALWHGADARKSFSVRFAGVEETAEWAWSRRGVVALETRPLINRLHDFWNEVNTVHCAPCGTHLSLFCTCHTALASPHISWLTEWLKLCTAVNNSSSLVELIRSDTGRDKAHVLKSSLTYIDSTSTQDSPDSKRTNLGLNTSELRPGYEAGLTARAAGSEFWQAAVLVSAGIYHVMD